MSASHCQSSSSSLSTGFVIKKRSIRFAVLSLVHGGTYQTCRSSLKIFKRISFIPEIYIAAPREYQAQLSQFLSEYGNTDSASVEFVWVDDMTGSADGLRAVHDRIRYFFIHHTVVFVDMSFALLTVCTQICTHIHNVPLL